MKPECAFIAERALAQHCAQLLRVGPGPAELLPLLDGMGERLVRALAPALTPLLGDALPLIRRAPSRVSTPNALAVEIPPLAANSLMIAGSNDAPLLVSLDASAVLRLLDRAFGGRGHVAEPLPECFPMSAELLITRLESLIARCLGLALGREEGSAIRTLRRDGSYAQLAPFADDCPLAVMTITVEEAGGEAWSITLAFPIASLAPLLGHGERTAARQAHTGAADPASEPFGDMPLPITAVLVDMRMAVSAVARIEPGSVLPVAVARSVPLCIGETVIARGSIGALDDRVAVQLTDAF